MYRYIGAIIWLFAILSYSQELPPIVRYQPEKYGGGNQNWMFSQNDDNHIFAANNEGLLHFNGERWQLYPTPNETILRSVKSVGDKIYTGAYMEFGYWSYTDRKQLKYNSLSDKLKGKLIEDEQFWGIIAYDHWVLFQSLNRIYLYDTRNQTFDIITPPQGVLKLFKCKDEIFFQSGDNILYKLKNGKIEVVSSDKAISQNRIINIFPKTNGYFLLTREEGFFLMENGEVTKWDVEVGELLTNSNAYSSIRLKSGLLAIGTISKGIFLIDQEGRLVKRISQTEGLGNNTVLSLFEDAAGNLWSGLDNGINCINLNSPVHTFNDDSGILGTVYTSAVYDGNLYIGTNQGLFVKAKDGKKDFRFLKGTGGQVWSLFVYDNSLFCGHDNGVLVIKDGEASFLYQGAGIWNFTKIEKQPTRLLMGGYNGFSILSKIDGKWSYSHQIKDFGFSSKHFELIDSNTAFMSHEYKGVYKVVFDKDFTTVKNWQKLEFPVRGKDASLVKYNNELYYAFKEGVFKLFEKEDKFKLDSLISKVFADDRYISGKMVVTRDNRLWIFTRDKIVHVTTGKLSKEPIIGYIFIPALLRKTITGYENVTLIKDQTFLFGATDGYFILDLNRYKNPKNTITIDKVLQRTSDTTTKVLSLKDNIELAYKNNSLSFEYSTPFYEKYRVVEYQYYLEPFNTGWSNWSKESHVSFENLPYGDYSFKVKSRSGKNSTSKEAVFNFVVKKPWVLSNTALILYAIFLVLLAFLIHYTYRTYYRRQEALLIEENSKKLKLQQLANEQEIIKMRNAQLRQDIESKSRELAASTMNLINKNEILGRIKKDLQTIDKKSGDLKAVLRTIDKNINEDDNWNVFKDAFNNADKDFLKKVKKIHPELTHNDLRLCAYLRLNLSSKEIAPLLNISPRSVEIKRYRLRKKMKLAHEKSLVEYILDI